MNLSFACAIIVPVYLVPVSCKLNSLVQHYAECSDSFTKAWAGRTTKPISSFGYSLDLKHYLSWAINVPSVGFRSCNLTRQHWATQQPYEIRLIDSKAATAHKPWSKFPWTSNLLHNSVCYLILFSWASCIFLTESAKWASPLQRTVGLRLCTKMTGPI